jgi:hypothetical protein
MVAMGIQIEGASARAKARDFALREFPEDGQAHLYRKRELADPGIEWLIPWCQEDELYPARHPRDEVFSRFLQTTRVCHQCGVRECGVRVEMGQQSRSGF